MKVGGNESATKFFQTHGGSALLAQKDAKARYTSSVATKYKDELKRRAAADAREFPEEVVLSDILSPTFSPDGTSTPSGEPGADSDDFFSSWDKPAIKRPSNPPSRSATPATRSASPFLKAGGSAVRSTSPSGASANENGSSATSAPVTAPRTISSSALRKAAATSSAGATSASSSAGGAARKTNILGAKRTQKLGAKKVGASAVGEPIDFEEAEKKAKEEAERIAKLGYDPNAEEEGGAKTGGAQSAGGSAATPLDSKPSILSPTPISPPRGGVKKSGAEMERLGMGIGRLGFGQTAGKGGAAVEGAAAKKGPLGFGSVGPVKATAEGMTTPSQVMQAQSTITQSICSLPHFPEMQFLS